MAVSSPPPGGRSGPHHRPQAREKSGIWRVERKHAPHAPSMPKQPPLAQPSDLVGPLGAWGPATGSSGTWVGRMVHVHGRTGWVPTTAPEGKPADSGPRCAPPWCHTQGRVTPAPGPLKIALRNFRGPTPPLSQPRPRIPPNPRTSPPTPCSSFVLLSGCFRLAFGVEEGPGGSRNPFFMPIKRF